MKITINKTGSIIPVLTLISILILSVSLASAAADYPTLPNRFAGDVTLNGHPAPVGTIISAYIGGELRGSVTVATAGKYVQLGVEGSSLDDGLTITFTVSGVAADQTTATWQEASSPRTLALTATGTPISSSGSSPSGSSSGSGDGAYPPPNGGAVDDTGDPDSTDSTDTSSVPDDGATAEPSTEATTTATDESGAGSEENGTFPWIVLILAGLAVAVVVYLMRK